MSSIQKEVRIFIGVTCGTASEQAENCFSFSTLEGLPWLLFCSCKLLVCYSGVLWLVCHVCSSSKAGEEFLTTNCNNLLNDWLVMSVSVFCSPTN